MLSAWRATVARLPDAPAVHAPDGTLGFAEVDRAAHAFALRLLEEEGLTPGDRVGIHLQNDPEWLVALVGCWVAGMVPVAVNPMLREAELRHLVTDSGARVLVTRPELAGLAAAVAPRTIPAHTLLPAAAGGREERLPSAEPGPGDVALLTYTSGTTGRSKGAMNTHSGMLHSSRVFAEWHRLDERDVVLGTAPLFHITGSVAGMGITILTGAPLVLTHRFDATAVLDAVHRHRATFTVAPATAYLAMTEAYAGQDLSSLQHALSGGAPVTPAVVDRVRRETGLWLRPVYGLTETTSPTHLTPVGVDPPVDPASGALATGVPVPGAEVRLIDPGSGAEVPLGEQGEICVRGPMVVPGYWENPAETARAIRDGWLHTGDVGVADADGWLFVVDRLKDLINASGYKVWPREVEDVLLRHPAVREAVVVGVPDDYRGETVKAFVTLRDRAEADPAELVAFCRDRLAAYKYPREVEVRDDLPRTASGKLLRRELRDA